VAGRGGLPRGHIGTAAPVAAPDGSAVAYVVTHRPGPRGGGTDDVEILPLAPGARGRSRRSASRPSAAPRGAVLFGWHGRRLHHRNGDRRLFALDTTGAQAPVELTPGA
jgi:hypothetical protein